MKLNQFIPAFLALFVLVGCDNKEDDMTPAGSSANPTPIVENAHVSGQNVSADFLGRITNKSGDPVSGAMVNISGSSTTTNAQGFYSLENVSVDENYAVVKVEANGMFDQYRALKPRTGETNLVDITLIRKLFNGFFNTSAGGEIDVPGGGKVTFPAGGLVTESGQPYSGDVLVASTYLDPSDPGLMSYMPGSLAAVSEEGNAVGMITYGMIGLELYAAGTQAPLQLADGRSAEIEMPLPEGFLSHAPDEIPLWYFDETAAVWQEEGSASLQGNKYVGLVSHFTFWNCDVSVNSIYIEGNVLLHPSETPLSDISVKIQRPNGGSATTQLESDGYFGGIVPGDELLTLTVESGECNQVLYSEQIGPFDNDVDLGDIIVDVSFQDFGIIQFEGSAVDCELNPVSGLQVLLSSPFVNSTFYTITNESGEWSFSVPCLNQGQVYFNAIDIEQFLEAEELVLPYDIGQNTLVDAGEIDFCDAEEITEYLIYSDGQNELAFDVVQASIGNCDDLYAFKEGSESTDYFLAEDFFSIAAFGEEDTSWGFCTNLGVVPPFDIRGYNSQGDYVVISMSELFFNSNVLQYFVSGQFYLFEGELTPVGTGPDIQTLVTVYESHLSTVPIDEYEADSPVLQMLVTETQ